MFVFSIKAGKKKSLILLAAILLVAVSVTTAVRLHRESEPKQVSTCQAATNGERIAFLTRCGWNVEAEPLEIREVTIPLNFNDVYGEYNKIQKAQNMDLLPYAGKRCNQWIYRVTNHPKGEARANVIVYNDRIIGGDISATALDGFMTGFQDKCAQESSSTAPVSSTQMPCSSESNSGSSVAASSAVQTNVAIIPDDAWPTD